jgi:hypothetical protein
MGVWAIAAAWTIGACDRRPECPVGFVEVSGRCVEPDAGVDAAADDAGGGGDAASPDGGASDAQVSDGGDACADCGGTRACVRGACIPTCGLEAAAIASALAPGLTPIAHGCRAVSGPIDLVPGAEPARPRIYELVASTSGTVSRFTIVRWMLDESPSPETVATATYDAGATGAMVFASGYVAVSPDEMRVLFGYTTTLGRFAGGVYDAELGRMTLEFASDGNFDAEWLDAGSFVVNGLQFDGIDGGQGLYVRDRVRSTSRHRATDMGSNSGSVAVAGDVVIAGGFAGFGTTWPDGSEGGYIFVLDRAALVGGGPVIRAWEEARARLAGPSVFERLEDGRLAYLTYDADFAVSGIEARALRPGRGGGFELAPPEPIATGSTFTAIAAGAGDTFALVHAGGVLLVRDAE